MEVLSVCVTHLVVGLARAFHVVFAVLRRRLGRSVHCGFGRYCCPFRGQK